MINSTLSKTILGVGFVGAILFVYEAFMRNTVDDLGSNKKLERSGLVEDWRNGNVILLIRHEERCDRSSNPCLGPLDGITHLGTEKAKETGARIRSYFGLDNVDIFTTPFTRTIQTSSFMLGGASQLSGREAICGDDIVDKLLQYKTTSRNLLVMTHNRCINHLIRSSKQRRSGSTEYGSLFFAKISAHNELELIGKLNASDLPK